MTRRMKTAESKYRWFAKFPRMRYWYSKMPDRLTFHLFHGTSEGFTTRCGTIRLKEEQTILSLSDVKEWRFCKHCLRWMQATLAADHEFQEEK